MGEAQSCLTSCDAKRVKKVSEAPDDSVWVLLFVINTRHFWSQSIMPGKSEAAGYGCLQRPSCVANQCVGWLRGGRAHTPPQGVGYDCA